jgi:hypothetical protein
MRIMVSLIIKFLDIITSKLYLNHYIILKYITDSNIFNDIYFIVNHLQYNYSMTFFATRGIQ